MDLSERFKRRIDERRVATVLQCIAAPPNKRGEPTDSDLAGVFDFWFDGGAAAIHTGYIEFTFADGTRATLAAPCPALSVTIEFPNGCRVKVQQESWGSE
jgi:hypothetical protein